MSASHNGSPTPEERHAGFRLGLFGDTRSGKTVFLTSLQCAAESRQLPADVGIRPGDTATSRYLGSRVALLRAGLWPPGTLDSTDVSILLDRRGQTIEIMAADFKGGDFGEAFFAGKDADRTQFIHTLYGRAHAYLFLVDPGPIKAAFLNSATKEDQDHRERAIQSITGALGVLQNRIGFFHKPVAIAFTKTDKHPDIVKDPVSFAKTYLPQATDYLHRHAPHHSFFAISAIGDIKTTDKGPAEPLNPRGIVEPFTWCADCQRRQRKSLVRHSAVSLLMALVVCYGVLWHLNGASLAKIRSQLPQSNYQQLRGLYDEVRGFDGMTRYKLTHPSDRIRLRQDVATAAEGWIQEHDVNVRCGSQGHIRSSSDWAQVQDTVNLYCGDYPGTENATRLSGWIEAERGMLAADLATRISVAAIKGNAQQFEALLIEYKVVQKPESDVVIREAAELLARQLLHENLRRVYSVRRTNREDTNAVLEACRTAEDEMKSRPVTRPCTELDYLTTIRRAYARPSVCTLSFRITSNCGRSLKSYTIGVGDKARSGGASLQPLPLPGGKWEFVVKVDCQSLLISHQSKADISITNYVFFGSNHHLSWSDTLGELPLQVTTDGGEDAYFLELRDDDGAVKAILDDNEALEKYENGLFQ